MSTTDPRSANVVAASMDVSPAGPDSLSGHLVRGSQDEHAAEGQDSPQAKHASASRFGTPTGSKTALPANEDAMPMREAPEGRETSRSQSTTGPHSGSAAAEDFPGGHWSSDAQDGCAAGEQAPATAMVAPMPSVQSPWPDEFSRDLAAAADTLDDIERLRIASENRLRQFTRDPGEADKDGKRRGYGWDLRSPAVVAQATLIATMKCDSEVIVRFCPVLGKTPKRKGCCLEHDAERNLARALRAHPLGPWVKAQKGIGEKQGARLIAVLGDPYMRPALLLPDGSQDPARPRTVSELWAYCGLKPGQKRKRGERANWSAAAKMRAWNVAGSMLKAGNRGVYDKRKAHTEGRVHAAECVRCGPSGKPAQPGSAWSDGHRHADALRVVSKEILKDIWREARRIHLETPVSGQRSNDTQGSSAADGD